MLDVSIIMPVYNSKDTVAKAIESVVKQKYNSYELIIVNDGSYDETIDICKNYEKRYKEIKIIEIENHGPSYARNVGIDAAIGTYIMFIDADDLYEKESIKKMICAIKMYDVDIITGNYVPFSDKELLNASKIKKNIKFKKKEKYIDYLQSIFLLNTNWNKIYKTEIIKNNNLKFDENKKIGEDLMFNLKYITYSNGYAVINSVVYKYYYNTNGLTHKNQVSKSDDILFLLEYQNNLYKKNNLNRRRFQNRIFKDFFHIFNLSNLYEKEKKEKYINIILSIKHKKIKLNMLYLFLSSQKMLMAKFLIKLYNIFL